MHCCLCFVEGFGLAGLGAVLAVGRQALKRSAELLRTRLLVDVEITRNDESYQWLLHWMSAYHRNQMVGTGTRHGNMLYVQLQRRVMTLARSIEC